MNVQDTAETINLVVNGEPFKGAVATLADLIDALGYGEQRIATAVNGDFVPAAGRSAQALAAGDHVEIVAPRQGG